MNRPPNRPILSAMSEKPAKRRVSGGRTTPKGTRPDGFTPETVSHTGHEDLPPSPAWVPALMFGLLGLGIGDDELRKGRSLISTNMISAHRR